jgi:hypothetical protein
MLPGISPHMGNILGKGFQNQILVASTLAVTSRKFLGILELQCPYGKWGWSHLGERLYTYAVKKMHLGPSKSWWVVFPFCTMFGRQQDGASIWIGEKHQNKHCRLIHCSVESKALILYFPSSHRGVWRRYSRAVRRLAGLHFIIFHGSFGFAGVQDNQREGMQQEQVSCQ